MNNKTTIVSVIGVVLLVIVGVVFWNLGRSSVDQSNSGPSTSSSAQTQTQTNSQTSQGSRGSYSTGNTVPVSSATHYSSQYTCQAAAQKQATALYPGTVATVLPYLDTTGLCFDQISLSQNAAGTTTTTNLKYFRNVSTNKLIADCSQSVPLYSAPGAWQCTNRVSGQPMTITEFYSLISATLAPPRTY